MACAGVDFGNKSCVVAIARRGGIDICCNEVSNRSTPTVVSFQGNERLMGEAAASIAAQNQRNTVSSMQRLLGFPRSDPFAEAEAKRVTCPVVAHPDTAASAVQVSYSGLDTSDTEEIFSMEAVTAMLLTNLMATASEEYKAPVRDLVISVPNYYTEGQRRAILNAAAIANVNPLRVINEHAAIALSYGIFRTKELPESEPLKVAFVDIGEASTSVSISAFTSTRCDVLCSISDPSLGGRDLDDIIVTKFANEFKEKHGIDVLSKPKPAARLRKDCEKVKKILSANPEAPLNIECLMNDVDVQGHMKREDLEAIAAPLLDRISQVCERAITEAGLKDGDKLAAVEIVGGSTRVPAFKRVITEVFSKYGATIRTTLNADECIARGCALMSAMLSPAFRVREYIVNDVSIHALDAEKVFTDGTPSELFALIPKNNPMPCLKAMTFKSPGALTMNIRYHDPKQLPICKQDPIVCGFLIDAPVDLEAKVRAKIRLTANGTVEMASALLMKEVEVEEEVVVKDESKANLPANDVKAETLAAAASSKATSTATANGNGSTTDTPMTEAEDTDAPMSDAPSSTEKKAGTGSQAGTEAGQSEAENANSKAGPTEAAPAKEVAPTTEKRMVKKTKYTELQVTPLPGIGHGLSNVMVTAATEREAKMRANDLYLKERSEAMNSLEGYVYDLRSRIGEYGDLKEFGASDVRSSLKTELDEAEEWIYSEEAEKASKSAFIEKKGTLKTKADPIVMRKRESEERPVRISVLEASLDGYKQVCVAGAAEYEHIEAEKKEIVMKCVEQAGLWLKEKAAAQSVLAKDVDPVLSCQALNDKLSEVDKVCQPIKKTPKPKPEPTVEEAAAKEGAGEGSDASKGADAKSGAGGKSEAPKGDAANANGDAMDVEGEAAPKAEAEQS